MRQTALKILNPLLLLLLANQLITGWWPEVYGFERWDLMHRKMATVFAAVAVLHLLLNGGWVLNAYRRRRGA